MKLLVGLGNPGVKYETTRHNMGFLVVDELAERNAISWSGKKFDAVVAKGSVFGIETVFIKPQTFMNLSGKSVLMASKFFKIPIEDIIVIYDDIDMVSGKVKSRRGGGHGGHNGIRSMMASLGGSDFEKIKVGVGRPENSKVPASDWVLSPLSDEELESVQKSVIQDVEMRLEGIYKQSR
ncbi:MAG: aminoacyl-tRNA hydrolase [Pseudobacteriovorax sp.]|nr:aminoacyl-tRNA hydrolase [Pseudobacteriovorax sp.]